MTGPSAARAQLIGIARDVRSALANRQNPQSGELSARPRIATAAMSRAARVVGPLGLVWSSSARAIRAWSRRLGVVEAHETLQLGNSPTMPDTRRLAQVPCTARIFRRRIDGACDLQASSEMRSPRSSASRASRGTWADSGLDIHRADA